MKALQPAGAGVTAGAHGALIITGLPAERVVVLLNENAIPFAEVSAHRASLEDAYLRLTQDSVEFRAGGEAAR
jgi:ABC-2 type transport system ATP-binding protein